MSIQKELLQFAAGLPAWEQDLIRRLTTQASVSEAELDEIQAMLYAAYKVPVSEPAPIPVPASQDHFRAVEVTLPKTVLLSLKDVEHTNRLTKGQVLPFDRIGRRGGEANRSKEGGDG